MEKTTSSRLSSPIQEMQRTRLPAIVARPSPLQESVETPSPVILSPRLRISLDLPSTQDQEMLNFAKTVTNPISLDSEATASLASIPIQRAKMGMPSGASETLPQINSQTSEPLIQTGSSLRDPKKKQEMGKTSEKMFPPKAPRNKTSQNQQIPTWRAMNNTLAKSQLSLSATFVNETTSESSVPSASTMQPESSCLSKKLEKDGRCAINASHSITNSRKTFGNNQAEATEKVPARKEPENEGESSDSSAFRLHCKKFFLTYPKVTLQSIPF